jgi:hypothetical protein
MINLTSLPRQSQPRLSGVAAVLVVALVLGPGTVGHAQQADRSGNLGPFFGFEPTRTIVIDRDCGPVLSADFNGDGRPDLAVVNNGKSRIELYLLRAAPKSEDELLRDLRTNQMRPTPWYDRVDVSVPQRVNALRAFDVDRDGRLDLVYAGTNPAEIVTMRQDETGSFRIFARQRVRDLAARQPTFLIADVTADASPELITVVEDRIHVFPLAADGTLGEPRRLTPGRPVGMIMADDFDGDGLLDLMAVVADEQMPLRLWRQRQDPRVAGSKAGFLSSELRFESPSVRAADHARFPGRSAASIGVIERVSRRVVFYDLVFQDVERLVGSGTSAEREAQAEVFGFADGANKDRSVVVIDLDSDGLPDLLATDSRTNTIAFYRQSDGIGLGDPRGFASFKATRQLAAAGPRQWDDSPTTTVFVLSEEEKAVGVARWDADDQRLTFPVPLPVKTEGATPVAIGFVRLDGVGALASVVRARRDHTLELHRPALRTESDDGITAVRLEGVNRPPQSMLAADVDQDGLTDLMLFTPGEPMILVRGVAGEAAQAAQEGRPVVGTPTQVLTSERMPQFGLVQAAGPNNTALFDVDGDGRPELLIADRNFVRACRYDARAGWRVVAQVNIADPGTELSGLAVLPASGGEAARVVASDRGNNRLLFIQFDDGAGVLRERVRLMGFTPGALFVGPFGGDRSDAVLCVADDAFGLLRLAGQRVRLDSFATYRSDSRDRAEFDIELGDINADGFIDAVIMDSGEQTCSILTFSQSRRLFLATEFKIFQSRLFTGGDGREFEPRQTMLGDFTGRGTTDMLLLIHDRVMIYPSMISPPPDGPRSSLVP